MKAVLFGAGNIGRGFLAQVVSDSGGSTTFVEARPEVVEALNARGRYPIVLADDTSDAPPVWVERVSALHAADVAAVAEAIAEADLVATAVGVPILPKVAPSLAAGLALRFERGGGALNVLVAENLLHAGPFLREAVRGSLAVEWHGRLDAEVGFVEASIGRMVPLVPTEKATQDPLWIAVEPYCELPVDAEAFRGSVPRLAHLKPMAPFEAIVERKLFVHNAGHATAAYLGWAAGDEMVWQAMRRPEIERVVLGAMRESAEALHRTFGLPLPELQAHAEDLIRRFRNRALGDQVRRVAADPWRKLGPNDRFFGAIRRCLSAGVTPHFLAVGAKAALAYREPTDPAACRLHASLTSDGLEATLQKLGVGPSEAIWVLETNKLSDC